MALPKKDLHEAVKILSDYYKRACREAAEEVIERREAFEDEFGGAEELVNKHIHRLRQVGALYDWIRWSLKNDPPTPPAKGELACLSCGASIKGEEKKCRYCGWTWERS